MTEVPAGARWRGRSVPKVTDLDFVPFGDLALPREVVCELTGADDIGGRWPDIRIAYAIRAGVPMCVSIEILSKPGDRPVRPDFLSDDDVTRLGDAAFVAFAMSYDPAERSMTSYEGPTRQRSILGRAAQSAVRHARDAGTGPGRSYDELRRVALVYLDPMSAPNRALAVGRRLYPTMTMNTPNRRIRAARDAGLIPPVGAGEDALRMAWAALNAPPAEPLTAEQARARLDEHLYGKGGTDG